MNNITTTGHQLMPGEMRMLAENIFETVREPLIILDEDLKVKLANRSFYETFQATEEETAGTHLFDLGNGQWSIPRLRSLLEDILPHNTELQGFEMEHDFPAIGRKVMLLNARRLYDEAGRTQLILLAIEDITERKLADEALRQSEERFRSLIENSADAISLFDPEGAITYASPSTPNVLGYTPDELARFNAFELIHEDDRELVAVHLATVVEQPRAGINLQARVRHKDGTWRWLEGTFTNLLDEPGVGAVVNNFRDISERKQIEEQLSMFAAKLERSNRELQDFASIASHDLQEPLRKIQTFGDRLKAICHDALGEEGRDYLVRMQSAAGRMQTLINDLLTFARLETKAQPFVPVDLSKVTWEVISDLEVQVNETQARVEVGELPVVEAEPLQMRQLLQNLIGNSLKYRHPEKTPVIKVHAAVTQERRTQFGRDARSAGQLCRIYVEDNGIGFDEKYLDRIFTVFQRLHGRNQYEGTGVGLAVCKKIAEHHGGSITAHSSPGGGATFVVTLPMK